MSGIATEEIVANDLAELAHKTGLVIRPFDAATVNRLFTELEKYDEEEQRDTFAYLKNALNETRASLGAEPVYTDE
jgi:hypothetical protein